MGVPMDALCVSVCMCDAGTDSMGGGADGCFTVHAHGVCVCDTVCATTHSVHGSLSIQTRGDCLFNNRY